MDTVSQGRRDILQNRTAQTHRRECCLENNNNRTFRSSRTRRAGLTVNPDFDIPLSSISEAAHRLHRARENTKS